jgi:tetratricopeptide (TPR) repeat protein
VFNLGMRDSHVATTPPTAAASSQTGDTRAEPTDADGFGRRGAARAAVRDYDGAIADLTKAMALAPDDARFPYRRAQAHLARREPALARADLDLALKLAPSDVDARMMRAGSHLGMHQPDVVAADLDAASQAAAPSADQRLALAELYQRIDRFAPAVAQYDRWLAAHPDDSRKAEALNGRCWTRALSGQDLDRALADCNAALKLRSGDPSFLDSRALVQLRRGDNDRAVADYDSVLKIQPRRAWALYGRGLARQRKGLKAEGDADIAAAVAIDKELPARLKALGVAP